MFAEAYFIDFEVPGFWAVIAGLACVLLVIVPAVVLIWSLTRKKSSSRED